VSGTLPNPTPRQLELLRYLHGRPVCPTIAEIAEALGGIGKSSVAALLDGLEERGWIRRLHSRARAIEVLRAPPAGVPLKELTREEGLAHARAWRERMKPHFDALYGAEEARG
jgi:SOS-response transcriptional repressor LexA